MIHLFAGSLRFLDVIPRSRWLSIAGGVAVAYAFVHLLPELQQHHEILRTTIAANSFQSLAEHLLWLMVLSGLVLFYGLEKLAIRSKTKSGESTTPAFWLHIVSYAIYNALLGYLLVREDRGLRSLSFYLVGIGLHFLVNDHGLRQHHRQRYHRAGRWILSAAVLAGWGVGVSTELHEAWTASTIAFLSGGILLNTFKEELPEERESRFWAFALGAFSYAGLLLVA
ncbi:putative membrane protein [Rhodopirellula maiorica SM1]|uniref:Putative membrane protein n=1 Tax=Rhodopirellula maiorica SM1 TaxID=1265738 RepID=M5RBJ1_9BACT|nr:putative membrane protein [Rhodopirellula maiorica SM1]